MRRDRDPRGERGLTLLEILFALAIFMLIMVGVLQVFSAALLSDRAAEARSELAFKAQQVVETVRMADAIARSTNPVPANLSPANTGMTFPIAAAMAPLTLPEKDSDPYWGFWGPDGAGVMEPGARYRITVRILDGDATGNPDSWVIEVTATPRAYVGFDPRRRAVRYVAYVRK